MIRWRIIYSTYPNKGVTYELPSEEEDIPDDKCMLFVKLSELNLSVGDKLHMFYDFGCDQEFDIEIVDIQSMGKGQGRAYPKIIAGEGCGIIDDMTADKLTKVIRSIDKTDESGIKYPLRPDSSSDLPDWDYRNYDMTIDNCLLKGEIDRIAEGYEEFLE